MSTLPSLKDFGITPEEYTLYKGLPVRDGIPSRPNSSSRDRVGSLLFCTIFIVIALVIALVVLGDNRDAESVFWSVIISLWPAFLGTLVVSWLLKNVIIPIVRHSQRDRARTRLQKDKGFVSRIKLYEQAEAIYQARQAEVEEAQLRRHRQLHDHWMSMSGPEFERELATLYRQLGYRVESTPTSGDQGIDLILRKNGMTTVVQCKSHQKPVGPAIARELFGSMVAFRADDAILACTAGFTRGVKDFVKGKPITLISASELVSMGRRVKSKTLSVAELDSPPICPMSACKRPMVLRTGYRGRFWGCPRYPKCRGIRDVH